MSTMAGVPAMFSGVASRNPEDIAAMQAQFIAEEEARRKAMPIHLNVTEAKGGWIISGNAYNTLDRQVVVTSIDEAVEVLRSLMAREG